MMPSPSDTLHRRPEHPVPQVLLREIALFAHRISASFPPPAADRADEGLDLNEYPARNRPATFMFRVRDDSMIGASIAEDCKATVGRALSREHEGIVAGSVAVEYTAKRFGRRGGRLELRPENSAYPVITSDEDGDGRVAAP